ncbi:hypothetical protein BT63DRAFT_473522 [Microthyrium microscopicum]|uniref:Six-hairpin glycosidase n=1 Tax=Microthyrium microscopicum TaxID=703497 RepID=A0A6A6U6H0_9PEZI|nr:hypothetical protein BT63DRAFT_473522 [Microthyrium microscopicum]
MSWLAWYVGALWLVLTAPCFAAIDRLQVVDKFNPQRNSTANKTDWETPLQVGNGNFAFNADITGLQTIKPFNTLSVWGWHNSTPPPTDIILQRTNRTSWPEAEPPTPLSDPEPEKITYSEWQRRNPHRINLGRVGLLYNGKEIAAQDISETKQRLNLSSGVIASAFTLDNSSVEVETMASPSLDALAFRIQAESLEPGNLSVFLDFPYPVTNKKFEAPYMGNYRVPDKHTTTIKQWSSRAELKRQIDGTTYFVNVAWDTGTPNTKIRRVSGSHRFMFNTTSATQVNFVVHYSRSSPGFTPGFEAIKRDSKWFWQNYWKDGAFIDCTSTADPKAQELQRRIIQSQYLLAVNSAGTDPPQESGLVNNGWYGKFHMEMVFWHLAHWERWGKWERLGTVIPSIYNRFLNSSVVRATSQGYEGARWGKMSDSEGVSSPGEVNSLLIWQQPHPFYFAELEYSVFPTQHTLQKWHPILEATSRFMVSFPRYNSETKVYDLAPPIHIVSENTRPNMTKNPTFELAYWRFGLQTMSSWYTRQSIPVPSKLTEVYENLAPFPHANGTYIHSENLAGMWTDPRLTSNHPALAGIFGMLPPDPRLNYTLFTSTMAHIYERWNFTGAYGWDYALLAMTAVRMGDSQRAVDLLLDMGMDDAGYPAGGGRSGVPAPYFPSSGGLLLASAMLAGGWRELGGRHWPKGWTCEAEGFGPGI